MVETIRQAFYTPGDEFSPIPFWFWNEALEKAEIRRQIHDFQEKGVMGFVIHARIGLCREIQYLSDSFMELVGFAVAEAAALGMKAVLYDEAMYPSGSAHGRVVEGNPEYASRGLAMREYPFAGQSSVIPCIGDGERVVAVLAVEKSSPGSIRPGSTLKVELKGEQVSFDVPDAGSWSLLVFVEGFSRGTIRGIHFGEDDGEPEAPASADLLNPQAVNKFIALTHDRYYEVLKEHFGSTVIAMFTDEPDILGRCARPGLVPWTEGFLQDYLRDGNRELDLPALWLDVGEETENLRRNYRKAVNKRLAESYYKPLSRWCEDHGIALTGHPHESEDIGFLKYFQIPGQDIVWRWVAPEAGKGVEGEHSTVGKCSSDAARHAGRRRNANECFGCCGPDGIHWAFSADDMKWYLDWLFVRGVNLVYPHAFYYSLEGEKRYHERPPDVGPHNIWWPCYRYIATYVKRMCWLMTDSINQADTAVLCREDHLPWQAAKVLFQNQMEFNYLEDSLLLSPACRVEGGRLRIENQQYSRLVMEDAALLTGPLHKKLEAFTGSGGQIILFSPEAQKSEIPGIRQIRKLQELADIGEADPERDAVFHPLSPELRISHVVKEGLHFYLLVNEGEKRIEGKLFSHVHGRVEKWDPWKGTMEVVALPEMGEAGIPVRLDRRESLIFCIMSGMAHPTEDARREKKGNSRILELGNGWKIRELAGDKAWETNALESVHTWPGMTEYAGTLAYETDFRLEGGERPVQVEIDLGEVHEIVHVFVNGKDAGFKLWAPFILDISEQVVPGENTLLVQVTNSLANKLDKAGIKSGLLGPVKLYVSSLGENLI